MSMNCGVHSVTPFDVHDVTCCAIDRLAQHNRERFWHQHVVAINLLGSSGAGKTSVLEATGLALVGSGERVRAGVLTGDRWADLDANRLRGIGLPAESINDESVCHLDAEMVRHGLEHLPWQTLDYLFVENVGNLACTDLYDLGQNANVVALSVTEGEDAPLRHRMMFHAADLVLLTKTDLLPQLPDVSVDAIEKNISSVMPVPRILLVSARTGAGIAEWIQWLKGRRIHSLRGA